MPAFPGGVLDALGVQVGAECLCVRLGCGVEVLAVLEQVGDGLECVRLGGADQTDGAALDPTGCVQAGNDLAVLVHDATLNVGDDAALVVVTDFGQFGTEVADCTVDSLYGVVHVLAGADDAAVAVELVALHAQANDLAVFAEDLVRGLQEVQMQAAGCGLLVILLVFQPAAQGLHHDLGLGVLLHCFLGSGVELEVLFVQDDVHVAGVCEFAQLERGELHLCGAAATEDVHVGHGGSLQTLVDVVGDFGDEQVVSVLGEDAGDVQGDVAVTEHCNLLSFERPGAGVVGVAVVPGDEVCCAVGAVQVDAFNVQGCIKNRAGCENDGVVVFAQVSEGQVLAVFDVAEETDVTAVQDLVQCGDDALDAGVIRCHTVADQAEGGGVAVEDVDGDLDGAGADLFRLGEDVGGVNTGGTCTNNGDAQGACCFRHENLPFEVHRPAPGAARTGGELSVHFLPILPGIDGCSGAYMSSPTK